MDKDRFSNYISQGLSVKEIANQMQIGINSVKYWLKFYQLNTKHQEINYECPACGQMPSSVFSPFCSKSCSETEYSSNPNNYLKQKTRAWTRKLKLVNEKGGGCQKCGYCENLAALEFHHINPENKSFNIDARKIGNTKWEIILKEVEKCILICSNCHAALHSPDSEIKKVSILAEKELPNLDDQMRKRQPKKTNVRKTLGIPQKKKGNWPNVEEMKKLVWEKPSTELAKQIGVSDVAIKKFCKKWGIAKPPRGHWRKLECEKVVSAGYDPDGLKTNTDYESAASPSLPPLTVLRLPKYERSTP